MNKLWIVDSFTSTPYTGNPAAVMIVAEFPSSMQSIAAEMNLSETAFVKPLNTDYYHICWYTPTVEVSLCGHATLAAAHVLFHEEKIQSNEITFESLSGPLQVTREKEGLVMNFPLQKIGARLDRHFFEEALNVQGKIVEVLQAYDEIIIVLRTEEDVITFQPNFSEIAKIEAKGIIITAHAHEYDFVSRTFAPRLGINEDPVTGSAHCKLADYWSKVLNKHEFKAYQASARGGSLSLKIVGDRVLLKSQAVTIFEGVLKI
jgi:PhzF family phenazine biosynthesis protein